MIRADPVLIKDGGKPCRLRNWAEGPTLARRAAAEMIRPSPAVARNVSWMSWRRNAMITGCRGLSHPIATRAPAPDSG